MGGASKRAYEVPDSKRSLDHVVPVTGRKGSSGDGACGLLVLLNVVITGPVVVSTWLLSSAMGSLSRYVQVKLLLYHAL
jgi:hypothetical protein